MLAWLLIVSLFLFIFFRPSPNAGSARPSVSGRPDVAPSRTKQRLTINTSCLGDDTFSLEELATGRLHSVPSHPPTQAVRRIPAVVKQKSVFVSSRQHNRVYGGAMVKGGEIRPTG